MKIYCLLAIICLVKAISVHGITWNGDWAMDCDFSGNDLTNVASKGEQCSSLCVGNSACTHFTWTNYNGGTCWLKKGSVTKQNAFYLSGAVCGVVTRSGGKLIWSDEFDSQASVTNNWNQETGGNGWGNNELQFYTDRNAKTTNGFLEIVAKLEKYSNNEYTSARLVSKTAFKYGRFEIRAKLPRGRGTWPALWFLASKRPLNWPADGEIDLMEHVGYDLGNIYGTIHCKAYNHIDHTEKQGKIYISDAADNFHVYRLDWTSSYLKWYVDDRLFFQYDKPNNSYDAWPFDNSMNIIMNIAVGGNWGNVQGVDKSVFPQTLSVDYVRVYELN